MIQRNKLQIQEKIGNYLKINYKQEWSEFEKNHNTVYNVSIVFILNTFTLSTRSFLFRYMIFIPDSFTFLNAQMFIFFYYINN